MTLSFVLGAALKVGPHDVTSYFYGHYDIANIVSCDASGIVPGVFMNKQQFYK